MCCCKKRATFHIYFSLPLENAKMLVNENSNILDTIFSSQKSLDHYL